MKQFAIVLLLALPAFAQVAADANRGYRTPESRASIATRLADPHRDARDRLPELVNELKIAAGMSVADVGTGVGYLLPYLSRAVGAKGKVLAEDIFPDYLAAAKERAAKEGLANLEYILGTEKDAKLPAGCCDLILVLDAYHHFDYPAEMLAGFRKALKKGGRLAIVEIYKRPGAMPGNNAVEHVRIDEADLIKEVEANGFRSLSSKEFLPGRQYLAVFTPN